MGKKVGLGGKIKKAISVRVLFFFHLDEEIAQFLVKLGILEISRGVVEPLDKLIPRSLLHFARCVLPNLLPGTLPEIIGRKVFARHADDCKFLRKQFPLREIVQRWNQFALREIAPRAENDHRAGRSGTAKRFLGHIHRIRILSQVFLHLSVL